MIYIYYGPEYHRVAHKAHELLAALSKKKPEASIHYLNGETFKEGEWERVLFAHGLFVETLLVFGSRILENKEHKAYFEKHIKEIADSHNIFIFAEAVVPPALLKKIEKHAEKVVELSQKIAEKKEKPNLFGLTDALGAKNKERFFVEYERALLSGATADEIHPLLFWQIKSILSVKTLGAKKSPEAIGMKPFLFKKALGFSKNYTEEELRELSQEFTKLFHDARFGETDLELGILNTIMSLKS